MALSPGEPFAGYRILRLLGSGGMGEVYLAEHPRLPKRDALKVLPTELAADPDYRARFQREADLASTLSHPHIVSVHDRGEYNKQLWIAMDYFDGLDAARLLSRRHPQGMPLNQVVHIITAVASALDYAHKRGLLHRDVKPANIMLTHPADNDEQRVMLTDFGIARTVGDISGLTATNMTVGTIAYAAPEQLLGADLDGRTDQYALAATAYQLLSGTTLFPHTNPAVVISHHLTVAPPALSEKRPKLRRLDEILATALAKNPNERFTRCSDFARALDEHAANRGPSPSATTKPAPVQTKQTPRTLKKSLPPPDDGMPVDNGAPKRWPVVAGALAVLLAGAAVLAWRPWTTAEATRSAPTSALVSLSSFPSPTSAILTAPTTTTAAMPAIIDVEPTDYEERDSPRYYRWAYAWTPVYRECGIFPLGGSSAVSKGVWCNADFPEGMPEISESFGTGTPNTVQIVPPHGPTGALTEGSQPNAITLLPNHRITVGSFSCTALNGGGIDCRAPSGGFRFADGALTTRGPR